MDFRIISGPSEFDSNKHVNSLRSELDKAANSYLEGAKAEANERLGRLTPHLSLERQEEEQKAIDQLFLDQKEGLREQFKRQLSPQELNHYLDDLQQAWGETFDVKAHVQLLATEVGSLKTASSTDPLQTALAEAEAMENSATNTGVHNLAADMVAEINSLLASHGTITELQNWIKSKGDLMWTPEYKGALESDVTQVYTIGGLSPPSFTQMDNYLSQIQQWQETDSKPVAQAITNLLLAELNSAGPNADPSLFQSYAQDVMDPDPNSGNIPFAPIPSMVDNPDEIYKYCQITGAQMEAPCALAEAKSQLARATTPAQIAFFTAMINHLGGSYSTFQTWAASAFITQDEYMQFVGIDQASVQQLFYIAFQPNTAPAPSAMDDAYAKASALLDKDPNSLFLQSLKSEIYSLGSAAPIGQLQGWLNGQFTTTDIYWQYPSLSQEEVNGIYEACGLNAPPPTAMDTVYMNAESWVKGLSPTDPAFSFAGSLLSEIKSLGSYGQISDLQNWVATPLKGSDIYWKNPTFTTGDVSAIYGILQLTPPTHTAMDIAHSSALTWLASLSPSDPSYSIAQKLLTQIQSLGYNGQMSDLQNWLNANFKLDDIYWQFPGISQTNVNTLYTVCQSTPPTGPTALDTAYESYETELNNLSPNDPAYPLAQKLLSEINQLGSFGKITDLQNWLGNEFKTDDIYWNYPGISPQNVKTIYAICGISTPPAETAMDAALESATTWFDSLSRNDPAFPAAQKLLTEIQSLGSYAKMSDLQNWLSDQMKPNDIYWQFPGISSQNAIQLYNICQTPFPAGIPTAMDNAYLATLNWLNSRPPLQGNDLKLADALLAELAGLGSAGNFNTVTNWAQNIIDNNDPLFVNASSSAESTFASITGTTTFTPIYNDINAYLQNLENTYAYIMNFCPQSIRGTSKFARWCLTQWTKLDTDIKTANPDWIALGRKYGIMSGSAEQIKEELIRRDDVYHGLTNGGYNSAVSLFQAALNEISTLEKTHAPFSDLTKWAKSVNLNQYPGLSPEDQAEFGKLFTF